MFQFAPLLWGAGLGALGGLLTGQDPLKGAAIGGATGGLLGGLPAGAWGGGSASVAQAATPSMGTTLAPTLASTEGAAAAISPTFGYTANAVSPFAAESLVTPTAADIGAGFGAENIASMGTKAPTMWDEISPYMNVRDLGGAAMVAAQYQKKPQYPQAPAGGVSRGQAPQGTDVMALLQTIKQPERKRISLM